MTNNTTASMLTDEQIDAIANDGHRNVAGGIYAHHVHDFARDVERALVTFLRETVVRPGWKLVPIEPTEDMIVNGFESWPDQFFSKPEVWASFERMSGCQRAAHKAKLCYSAMLDAAPAAPVADPLRRRVERLLVELHAEGRLSEGQCAKMLDISRLDWRELAEFLAPVAQAVAADGARAKDVVTREQVEVWARRAGIHQFTEVGLARLVDFATFARAAVSPATAETCAGMPDEVRDSLMDSQYLAGVTAGWNAANADDPNAALEKIHASRAGYLKPLRDWQKAGRPGVPATPATADERAAFVWPPLPDLPPYFTYTLNRACFTEHQMQAYANAYGEAVHASQAVAPALPTAEVPIELADVKETLAKGDGFWRSCSGCHETEDGHPVGKYPYSAILRCDLGAGCSECGGIGAVWDNTDYAAMGNAFERAGLLNSPDAQAAAPAEAREPIGAHDLSTSKGGRGFVAEFFAKRLRRHDFGRYIADTLAADFACVLAGYLRANDHMPFQSRVQPWMLECFGPTIAVDTIERNHRFLEEALELVQSLGCTASEAHQLVDYTFGRPIGEPMQEVGGVMVTLAALCLASELDMHQAGETELARISEPAMVLKIRAKQAAKPKHSPLPQAVAARAPYIRRDTGPLSILRRRQVEVVTGLSRSTIYDRMKVGTFPAAVKIGPHSVGWRAGDIDAFLANPAGYRAQGGRS